MNTSRDIDPDIKDAVASARQSFWKVPARPVRGDSQNPLAKALWGVRYALWGIASAFVKLVNASRRHPWVALLGVLGSVAFCPVCKYATGTFLIGLACWGVASEGESPESEKA